jgi:predicted RNA-binding protein YlxR (DUF448 family)
MNPVRTCVGCRQRGNRSDLIRIANFQGSLRFDTEKKMPGRGSWLHKKTKCLENAVERKAFLRSFRGKVELEQVTDLVKQIEQAEMMLEI